MIRTPIHLSGYDPLKRHQAVQFVQTAGRYDARVMLEHGSKLVNGKSMLGLLSLGIVGNDPVYLIVEGDDETQANAAMLELLEKGFE